MKFRKSAIIIACIMVFSTILLVGCGSKNPYIGHWDNGGGMSYDGLIININEDGTFMERVKDPTGGDNWGKWELTENGIELDLDEYDEVGIGFIDENGCLNVTWKSEGSSLESEEVYRKEKK